MAASLHYICHHRIAEKVPLEETVSATDLALECKVNEVDMLRMLRAGMAWHIFCEPSDGRIGHSATSRVLREDPKLRSWITIALEDVWYSTPHVGLNPISAMREHATQSPHFLVLFLLQKRLSMRCKSGRGPKTHTTRYVI